MRCYLSILVSVKPHRLHSVGLDHIFQKRPRHLVVADALPEDAEEHGARERGLGMLVLELVDQLLGRLGHEAQHHTHRHAGLGHRDAALEYMSCHAMPCHAMHEWGCD